MLLLLCWCFFLLREKMKVRKTSKSLRVVYTHAQLEPGEKANAACASHAAGVLGRYQLSVLICTVLRPCGSCTFDEQ